MPLMGRKGWMGCLNGFYMSWMKWDPHAVIIIIVFIYFFGTNGSLHLSKACLRECSGQLVLRFWKSTLCANVFLADMFIPPWVKVLLYTVYTVDCPWVLEFSLQWMKLLPAEGCVWFRFWSTTSTSLRKIGSHNNYGTLSSVELKDWV